MNMNGRRLACPDGQRLEAYWDAEASAGERRRIEAHLEECAACRRSLQEIQCLDRALKAHRIPERSWLSDAEFWQGLAPRLRPREVPAHESQAQLASTFLAPWSLMLSSLALRGVVALLLIAYALNEWRVMPASLPAAFASAARLVVGPLVWETGETVCRAVASSGILGLTMTPQAGALALGAAAAFLLLPVAGLYIVWLLPWLRSQARSVALSETE